MSVEWYTPKWIFDELGLEFDLDPASPHDHETFVPAKEKYTIFDNGLIKPWHGMVWMNPPYGRKIDCWMNRLAHHGNGIALVSSRTDTYWFQLSMSEASAILFLRGRIDFVPGRENKHKESRANAASCLMSFGDVCADALSKDRDWETISISPA